MMGTFLLNEHPSSSLRAIGCLALLPLHWEGSKSTFFPPNNPSIIISRLNVTAPPATFSPPPSRGNGKNTPSFLLYCTGEMPSYNFLKPRCLLAALFVPCIHVFSSLCQPSAHPPPPLFFFRKSDFKGFSIW